MRVSLYTRVSTEEQARHGISLDAQSAALHEWAERNGHVIVGEYTDNGVSARKAPSKRPALQSLLRDISKNKTELIAFTKLDRWTRNVKGYYQIMIPRLTELVKEHKGAKTDYLVTAYPNSIYKEVNAICNKHNLPQVGVHGLRHSFVSLAYHLGWSELATMHIAGYSDPATMRRIYTHLAEADKKSSVKSMQQFFQL